MIPSNIDQAHILKAIGDIEKNGVPKGRESKKFQLIYNGKYYPPKYVVSLANKYANGIVLDSSKFSGGQETNGFLVRLGFNVAEFPSLRTSVKPSFARREIIERKKSLHNERCPECKKTIEAMLRKIYGKVYINYRFEIGTKPEDFKRTLSYQKLKEIFYELQGYRGYKDFVKAETLPHCDFFIPNPGFIVEFDESQHFSACRKISLLKYPQNLELGFPLTKWITLCDEINAKDNDPPFRDEQRAWYDTLRDFLPKFKGLRPTVRVYSKEMRWCSLNPESEKDIAEFKELIENRRKKLSNWIATVILQSNAKYSNGERLKALSQVADLVAKETKGNGMILFPGGWFSAGKEEARSLYKWAEEKIKSILSRNERHIVICLGIDGRVAQYAKDQIGIAICKKGIMAIGRKFHPAPRERGHVELASNHYSKEDGKPRIFELDGMRYFLCACYDSFGIKHKRIPNFGIDVILDLVHGFYPKGEGGSGDVYFAKHGFAGASKQWGCLVFGAAVFFNRKIPEHWPSGVYWNQGTKSTQEWQYADNFIKPKLEVEVAIKEGKALVRIYDLGAIS
jgi:hypothetical protein